MAEHFSFFDPVEVSPGVWDREYNAPQFTKYFGALVTTGVMKGMSNMLVVSANGSNMVTKINTGIVFIEGKYYENDSFLDLTHDTETLGNSRIDRIVVRMDDSIEARYVKAFIKKGVPSANPVAPPLTQTPNLYEISLAQVKVVGGQTFIATNAVTDERGKEVICPWAGSNILPNFNDEALEQLIEDVDTKLVDATTTRKGIVQLSNVVNESNALAATSYAVKTVNDRFDKGVAALGRGAHSYGGYGVAIGADSHASDQNYAVAIGNAVNSPNTGEGILGGAISTMTRVWKIPGSLSVTGTKNFEMPHPHPDKKSTHVIRHSAVESPTAGDNLYRYTINASTDGETVELQLPDYFIYLNKDVDVFVSPHMHFGMAFGIVDGDVLKVTCSKAGTYKVLVIGTRNDAHDSVRNWGIKGVEREIGESWSGETYIFEVDEIQENKEIMEAL